jgi:hypothetical protein
VVDIEERQHDHTRRNAAPAVGRHPEHNVPSRAGSALRRFARPWRPASWCCWCPAAGCRNLPPLALRRQGRLRTLRPYPRTRTGL